MDQNTAVDLGEARTQLYEILEAEEGAVTERCRQTLALGCAYLGVENAHLKEIPGGDGSGARVSLAAGDRTWIADDTPLGDPAFCRATVQQAEALEITDAEAEGYAENPGYADHGVACYLGARVIVDAATYGTVCFVSSTPRETSFAPEQRLFAELLHAAVRDICEQPTRPAV